MQVNIFCTVVAAPLHRKGSGNKIFLGLLIFYYFLLLSSYSVAFVSFFSRKTTGFRWNEKYKQIE